MHCRNFRTEGAKRQCAIISYHSFALRIRDKSLINICAGAKRQNGDYYEIAET